MHPGGSFPAVIEIIEPKIQPPSISAILEDAILTVDGGGMPYRSV
jgi:hypothetical protein